MSKFDEKIKEALIEHQKYIHALNEQLDRHIQNELGNIVHNSKLELIIKKALEFIDECCWYPDCNNYSNMTDNEVKELIEILKEYKGDE